MQLETLQQMPGHLVRRLNQISQAIFSARVDGADLTSVQYAALVAIASASDMTASRLAVAIAVDPANLGGVVERLEAKGLVARRPTASDRRAKQLRATPAGIALMDSLESDVRLVQESILAPLSSSERAQFMELLQKLVHTPRG
jgi:DNA-binding MarR family transcriptional regulator